MEKGAPNAVRILPVVSNVNYQRLEEIIRLHSPDANIERIRHAYDLAEKAHEGQKRRSGEDYIVHPLAVAATLAEWGLPENIIIAGLLHDVPEETTVSIETIEREFGREIAAMVAHVTKLGKIKYRGIERYVENLRKMFIAMAEDLRIILIKFADRMHNLKTLSSLPPPKQHRIALETVEIYAPIAGRLGMEKLKGILEDLAFPYLFPEIYTWLNEEVERRSKAKEQYLEHVQMILNELLREAKIPILSIGGRMKHLYSLYQKIQKQQADLSKIYDLIALRIIVPNVHDCYAALGILHQKWRPLPGRIKDYIAVPKPNGYQSLHTTVFCEEKTIVEFQIRTQTMHEWAEFGVAAHWQYSERKTLSSQPVPLVKNFAWFRDLLALQRDISDNEKYLASLKIDIFRDRIFVFTPKGDVLDLPEESTPVDFAYHIHTDVGSQCVGAKVNEKWMSLETMLKSGDVVEIVVDKNRKGPSSDWLSFVKTHLARERIRRFTKP